MFDTNRRTFLKGSVAVGSIAAAGSAGALIGTDESRADSSPTEGSEAETEDGYGVETVADELEHPWGIEFIPESSRMLVTEIEGRLNLLDRETGTTEVVSGTPNVFTEGQGGLLDVTVHPRFSDEPWVYLTYSVANDEGSATHLGRGRLDCAGAQLIEFEELYVAEPFADSDQHYGSRVVFDKECMLYVTVGDRRFIDFGPEHASQDTTNAVGTTLRLAPDGSVPDDNPFVDDSEAEGAIFSYGHRNVQAMTVHPETGELWQGEHGEQDGDEINVLEKGGNYGWPVTHYGCTYDDGEEIGEQPHERDDVVNPVYYWECNTGGFPPSGATFYDGDAFPDWRGDLFVGNLAGEYLGRFTVDDRDVDEVDPLLGESEWRIRDVAVAPDTGHLYVIADEEKAPLVRIVPE
jgi:aldose sugar dehydrogenase